jgi:glycosyltransferase involved in cell wall biosynthesis
VEQFASNSPQEDDQESSSVTNLPSGVEKSRLLLISSNSSEAGGGERYLDYLAQGFIALGHQVHVLYSSLPYMDGWARMLAKTGATVHRLPLKGLRHRRLRFLQSLVAVGQQRRIARFVRELAPDGVLVNMQYDEDGLDYFMGAASAKPKALAATLHMPMTFWKNDRPLGRWRGAIMRAWYRRYRPSLIMVSEGSRKEFDAYYRVEGLTTVVPNGIPWEGISFDLKQGRESVPGHKPTIAYAGRFDPQKGLERLVEAWLALHRKGREFRLLLIGDGVERPRIENLLKEQAPGGDWEITGWVNNPEEWMSKADMMVMTSRFEGLPLALVEAAGRGIPCVITPVNGAHDVGRWAPWVTVAKSHDVEAIVGSIEEVSTRLRTGDCGVSSESLQRFRGAFSIERMARETLQVLFESDKRLSA